MSTDYNDVDKLLSHMHLDGFGYRSFRKGEEPAAAQPVAAPQPEPTPAKPAVAEIPAAAPLRVVRPAEAQAAAPQAAPAVPAAVAVPAAAAPATAPEPVAAAPAASPRIDDTLQRLMRGSITDSAPRLDLHLSLPLRPAQSEDAAPAAEGERTLAEVFRKLHTAAAIKPRVVSGTER